jgi:glycosyltransferase involved in cell wall biosynthesis
MSIATPYVTVVVPSFNEDPHIVRVSLESIRAQTFTNFECIVVDESTEPELAEACRAVCAEDSRFLYIHPDERLGLPNSLNLAIGKARGQLIARFDSDDVCMPERLALQVAYLQSHPEIAMVGGALDIISNVGQLLAQRRYPQTPTAIARGMQLTTTIAHPTVMYRKVAIEQHGGYNPDFRFSEDLDLWLRWMNAGLLFANLPQVLVQYRQDSTTRRSEHWRFNLRARIANFSAQHLVRRIIGIACIAIWVGLPNKLQEQIFKALILRRRRQEVV